MGLALFSGRVWVFFFHKMFWTELKKKIYGLDRADNLRSENTYNTYKQQFVDIGSI